MTISLSKVNSNTNLKDKGERLKLWASFGKSQKQVQVAFLNLTFEMVSSYVETNDVNELNVALHAVKGTAFNAPFERLTREITFHRFDKEADEFSLILSPSEKRIATIKANWLEIYLKWQETFTEETAPKKTTKRDALTIAKERLESVLSGSEKMDAKEKQELYLLLLKAANSLQ